MVLNGQQVHEAVLGDSGLLEGLAPGATIIVSATINPSEVRELEKPVAEKGINLIFNAKLAQKSKGGHNIPHPPFTHPDLGETARGSPAGA